MEKRIQVQSETISSLVNGVIVGKNVSDDVVGDGFGAGSRWW